VPVLILSLVACGSAAASTAADSSVGINNRTTDGWASVSAYDETGRILTFCVGPGKSKQHGVADHIVTRVAVAMSRGASECQAPAVVAFHLPVHMMSATRALALGFVDGDRGKYTITDRL
jgi:hypothetical protein